MKRPGSTKVFRVDPKRPDPAAIGEAAAVLRRGGLVAFPTETVYGVGAHASSAVAMRRLRAAKKRPRGKPFSTLVADIAAARRAGGIVTEETARLARRFWPGPLTMVLRSKSGGKKGYRVPDHRVALALLRRARVPVAAPSANISGRKPPTDAAEVLAQLGGKVDILIDSGPSDVGVESTVIDMTSSPPRVLRKGAIKEKRIKRLLNADM